MLSIGAKHGAAFVQLPLLSIPPPRSPHTPYPINRNRLVSNPWTHNTEWKKAEAEETMQNESMQNCFATSNGYDAKGIKGHGHIH